jgi:hypothetical protein
MLAPPVGTVTASPVGGGDCWGGVGTTGDREGWGGEDWWPGAENAGEGGDDRGGTVAEGGAD